MIFARLRVLDAVIVRLSAIPVERIPDFETQRAIVDGIAELRREHDLLNDALVLDRRREYAERPYTVYQLAAHGATGGDIQ